MVTDREEYLDPIQNHHTGKINQRGVEETLQYLKRNYHWPKNEKNSVQN